MIGPKSKNKWHTYKHLLDRPKLKLEEKNAIEGTHFQDSGTEAAARLIDADLIR